MGVCCDTEFKEKRMEITTEKSRTPSGRTSSLETKETKNKYTMNHKNQYSARSARSIAVADIIHDNRTQSSDIEAADREKIEAIW